VNEKTSDKKIYQVKSVLLARMLAELTVFSIVAISPFILFGAGIFQKLHIIYRAMICLASPVTLGLAWAICQIPFRATIDESGISTRAFLKKRKATWSEMLSISLVNMVGWRHYRLTLQDGELTFPCQLSNVQDLVTTIRSHLPSRGRVKVGSTQEYSLAKLAHLMLVGQSILWLGFAIIFGSFVESVRTSNASVFDLALVLGLEILVSIAVIWQFVYVILLPRKVLLENSTLKIASLIKEKQLSLDQITSMTESKFPFPEGVKLKSESKKSFLLSSSMDNFDELVEELRMRLDKANKSKD
jgi:hypothetical protein